jgi:hypothetical protein
MAIIRRGQGAVSGDVSNSRILVSACLIVGLVAVIVFLMWIKFRVLPGTATTRSLELPRMQEERRRKGIERHMLESMPVVTYRESLELDEIDGVLKLHTSTTHPGEIEEGIPTATEGEPMHGPEATIAQRSEIGVEDIPPKTSSTSVNCTEMPNKNDVPNDTGRSRSRQCSVCTEDFIENEKIRILPCRHIYHKRCIDPWLLHFAGTCPLW